MFRKLKNDILNEVSKMILQAVHDIQIRDKRVFYGFILNEHEERRYAFNEDLERLEKKINLLIEYLKVKYVPDTEETKPAHFIKE